MVSEVDICNRALSLIHADLITSFEDDTESAIKCKIFYPQIRDEILREHFWNFAIDQAQLQKEATAPLFDFSNSFELPSDYIRIYRLSSRKNAYKRKGSAIHTDDSAVQIEYVKRITDTTKFDPLFTTILVLKLGASLAYPLAGSEGRGQSLLQEYEMMLKRAKRADGQEGTPDPITADKFVDARYGYRDWTG